MSVSEPMFIAKHCSLKIGQHCVYQAAQQLLTCHCDLSWYIECNLMSLSSAAQKILSDRHMH